MSEAAARAWPRLALRNPIVARELLTILRQPRSALLLGVALAISAAPVLLAWPLHPEGVAGQGALSRTIFRLFGYAQMLLLALVVPGTLAAALSGEKERDTIDLLLTTPLSGDAIVVGKLLGGLSFTFLLGLISIPALMFCSVLGGLTGGDVLRLYAVLAIQGLVYGLTSLCCSAVSRRTVGAVTVGYLLVGIEAALLVPSAERLERTLSIALPIVLIAYALARHAARRPYNPVPKPPPPPPDPTRVSGLVLRPDAFPDKLLLPPPRRGCLEDSVDPIFHKELSAGIHGAGSGFIRLVIQLGMVLGLIAFIASLDSLVNRAWSDTVAGGYYLFAFVACYAMTLGPAMGARAFTGEREQGTSEMLCMILVPPGRIVRGKYLAHLRVVVTLGALNTVPFAAFSLLTGSFLQLGVLAAILVATSVVSVAIGFWASLRATSTITAMLRSYLLLFGVWVLPALIVANWRGAPAALGDVLRLVSPFYAADVGGPRRGGLPGFKLLLLGVHLLLCGVTTWSLLAACARGFDDTMREAAER